MSVRDDRLAFEAQADAISDPLRRALIDAAIAALLSPSADTRDKALWMLERFEGVEGKHIAGVLEKHVDAESWLQEYARRVGAQMREGS